MNRVALRLPLAIVLSFAVSTFMGCASSSETAARDSLTAETGQYPAPPAGIEKPRVGVPQFTVQNAGSFGGGSDLDSLAADQMTTLLDQSERFRVIERAQLQKLLDEQNMEGIVKSSELAKTGQVRGVDYLLVGKVTNLRVKNETKQRGFGLGQVGGLINLGAADFKKKDMSITTEAGVDIRLVDPSTGEVVISNFSEYKRTDSAGSMGIDILGASAEADANITVDEDDKGKILRLALDDALRKSLPKIDRFLQARAGTGGGASAAPAAPAAPSAPAAPVNNLVPQQAAPAQQAATFCAQCGAKVAAGAKFCPSCGAKVE